METLKLFALLPLFFCLGALALPASLAFLVMRAKV